MATPLDFPKNPTIGQLFNAPNGVTYKWDGEVWVNLATGGGGGSGGGGDSLWTQAGPHFIVPSGDAVDPPTNLQLRYDAGIYFGDPALSPSRIYLSDASMHITCEFGGSIQLELMGGTPAMLFTRQGGAVVNGPITIGDLSTLLDPPSVYGGAIQYSNGHFYGYDGTAWHILDAPGLPPFTTVNKNNLLCISADGTFVAWTNYPHVNNVQVIGAYSWPDGGSISTDNYGTPDDHIAFTSPGNGGGGFWWSGLQGLMHLSGATMGAASLRIRVDSTGNGLLGQEALELNGALVVRGATGTQTGTIQYVGGRFQGRNASAWVNLDDPGGGGLTDAPPDGQTYSRRNGTWTPESDPNLTTDFGSGPFTGSAYNTIIGAQAGGTGGTSNTFVGCRVAGAMNAGARNVALGYGALGAVGAGNDNVAIGQAAGSSTNTDFAVSLGSGADAKANDAVAIGHGAVATAPFDFVLGTVSHNVKVLGRSYVAVDPTAALEVATKQYVDLKAPGWWYQRGMVVTGTSVIVEQPGTNSLGIITANFVGGRTMWVQGNIRLSLVNAQGTPQNGKITLMEYFDGNLTGQSETWVGLCPPGTVEIVFPYILSMWASAAGSHSVEVRIQRDLTTFPNVTPSIVSSVFKVLEAWM